MVSDVGESVASINARCDDNSAEGVIGSSIRSNIIPTYKPIMLST